MKTTPLFIFLILLPCFTDAQNLVPNPSFEEYELCPDEPSQIERALGWNLPTEGTSDYFHECAPDVGQSLQVPEIWNGYQHARTGAAYAGGLTFTAHTIPDEPEWEYREYIQTQLTAPLDSGIRYYVSFYVSLADSVELACNDFGAYFSENESSAPILYILGVTPQIENSDDNSLDDTNDWTRIDGSFIAEGGEEFIILGNFQDNLNSDTATVMEPTLLSVVKQAYYFIDDVCVSIDSLTCAGRLIDVHSHDHKNPLKVWSLQNEVRFQSENNHPFDVRIYSLMGRLIHEERGLHRSHSLHTGHFEEGVYVIQVTDGKAVKREKIYIWN